MFTCLQVLIWLNNENFLRCLVKLITGISCFPRLKFSLAVSINNTFKHLQGSLREAEFLQHISKAGLESYHWPKSQPAGQRHRYTNKHLGKYVKLTKWQPNLLMKIFNIKILKIILDTSQT